MAAAAVSMAEAASTAEAVFMAAALADTRGGANMHSAYISEYIGRGLAHGRKLTFGILALTALFVAISGLANAENARVYPSPQAAFERQAKGHAPGQ